MARKRVEYSEELADEICETIATSRKGVCTLCKEIPHWPVESVIYVWLEKHPSFAEKYTRAKQAQAHSVINEALAVAYDSSEDTYLDNEGNRQANYVAIQRAKLKLDTIKWIACKVLPKIYGDRNKEKDDEEDAISQFKVT